MIRRRRLLGASAGLLAAPALVEKVGAQSAFDWRQCKGQKIEVNYGKSNRADIFQARQKEFEELTGIKVGSEQMAEQQQRTKVMIEFSSGHPSMDVVGVALHVQKRLFERNKWTTDLRPMLADPAATAPDYDFADFRGPGVQAGTGPDGRLHAIPMNQDVFILFWNKQLLAAKGVAVPKTLDEIYVAAKQLTDRNAGISGFVARGLKNANVPVWTALLMGQDQETISRDNRTLLTDTAAAVWAADLYGRLQRDCGPPGVVAYNWNECQTNFLQGKTALYIDSIGITPPIVDPTKSKVVGQVGFGALPPGPKGQGSPIFTEGLSIAEASKNKRAAWLYVQWITGKKMLAETLRAGASTPPRASLYADPANRAGSPLPPEWFEAAAASHAIGRSGLPEIEAVTEFRDVFGIALTNVIGGADAGAELRKATEAFKPILAKENG